jgi:hypothetical protein
MQGRGGNRPGPFEGFPDPFANFGFGMGGGMGPPGSQGGGGGRRSLFDVFDNDPFFSDPFFTRPFGGSFGSLFGSHGGGFGNPFFGGVPQPPVEGAFLSNRPHNPHADVHRRGPIIEELPDDAEHPHEHARPQSNQEPIIEHPDDDVRPGTWFSNVLLAFLSLLAEIYLFIFKLSGHCSMLRELITGCA